MYAKKKHFSVGKAIAIVASLLLMVMAISGTLAYLTDKDAPIQNTFTPSKVTTTVEEKFENGVKSDVKIKNTGDTTAWIRAAVVVTWQDAQGNIYGQAPKVTEDYSIELNLDTSWETGNGWVKGTDGFYYYKTPVDAGEETGELITWCEPIAGKAPKDYFLCVEIICSGLQYKPLNVFNDNWASSGGTVKENENGNLYWEGTK